MLDKLLSNYPKEETYLIEILLDYQKKKTTNYISEKELATIASYFDLPESKVYSVMTFYTLLSTAKRGKNIIQVCRDIPCYLNESASVLNTLKDILEIDINETTKDNEFTLELTSCIGCCDESPSMRINEKTYTSLTPKKVKDIISSYWGLKS